MTALWSATVLDKGLDHVTVEVRQAHPDAGQFPESRAFALRLLHEQAWELDDSFNYRALGRLGAACDSKQVLDDAWIRSNVELFIGEITTKDSSTATLDEDMAVGQVLYQLGMRDLATLTDAERERFDEAYAKFWRTTAELPARRYCIQVTDPAYLSHLAVGARWASAAF